MMKRFLPIVPVILLVILNACGGETTATIPAAAWTAMGQTLTAASWTPTFTPSPTLDPNEQWMVDSMNSGGLQYEWNWENRGGDSNLATKLDQLEDTIGAEFTIVDIRFPPTENGLAIVLQVHARCKCGTDSLCCTAEHMFVLTMRNLYMAVQQPNMILGQVPGTVQQLEVVCYDRQTPFAVMSAAWADVQSFLRGEINGYQLGSRVTRE